MASTTLMKPRERVTPPLSDPEPTRRTTGALAGGTRRRYWIILAILIALALGSTALTMSYGNPMPIGSDGYWTIARLRAKTLIVVLIVTGAQAIATISFQTVTHNRILTPSIMGFESLYRLVQTAAVFALGAAGITLVTGVWQFLFQIALMVTFATILYGWLFGGPRGNLHITLLVGIVIGGGLGAAATFLQRLLTPSEFDLLTARLIGSLAQAREEYLLPAAIIVALAGAALWGQSRTLNVLALGREPALNLGINHRRRTLLVLVLTAILMATSTALIGPMTFLGFLVAMLAYQLADTYDHRYLFPMAWFIGFIMMAGAHFILRNVFYAQGSVGVIIELVGGGFFLFYILRKGRL
ncbi:iron chelate uptake ABC transporter family permease subunit [Bowdeniella nasicola]|nr:iron chelate uptake ABC transporter family permease subunit [Bowdeniella nasicola]